jgi:hypothetical protein
VGGEAELPIFLNDSIDLDDAIYNDAPYTGTWRGTWRDEIVISSGVIEVGVRLEK